MLQARDLHGIYAPVITPFLPNEELDLDSYRKHVQELLQHNIQGIIVNGTTGESPTVSWEEVVQLFQATKEVVQESGKQLPLIIGTGTNSTVSTVKRTELAGELGADAVLIVTPYYNRPPHAGVIEHYRRASQVGVPVIAYEVPHRTGLRLNADTVKAVLDLDGVIGIKDSTGNLDLLHELTKGDTKPVLCGDDVLFLSMMQHGATGGILASSMIQTEKFVEVYELAKQGDFAQAQTKFDSLVPMIQKLFQESNPAPIKWILTQQGILSSDTLRLPMSPISQGLQQELIELFPALAR
ncbi:4-hydroxy-tetrahydrodipicolinate synthase [Brevibacillus centrosporus]|uniref:4-hydroxy-tetrahydrodipicolinate synthase n=1 Tax=Brevibacillus centrosporus TaxID=54910 RepID=A0A1I3M5J8_9BACL|nr:4-hydroxy-tetrahydrodipicolinate synthase [Brevibacillus centrosporus]MEC2131262.1 4-hydroxy-tetrahydrodipicolinate synthase [Brevibacillus centrosporus]MED4906790.1 4-hydroxy-tetrahydrodipicolinate synthase [Brevibacillus centrosporus]RNB72701.1 4-hydroxy-tetrahydrodipicolinate synthase [Brevibacillus centrosporus]SFI92304.1 4-hydroxy-tetrahydrodipicolinate synthase [Brevibacillus centrosporus]GED33672.1 4-hydroxy-tetrahydrodipicolinate synthase 2 [Brevibacillus centrosporus]